MMLTISLIIVFLLVGGLISYLYIKDNDLSFTFQVIGFGGGIILASLYFGFVSTQLVDYTTYEEIKPISITKSPTSVFIQFKDFETKEYNTKEFYDNVDSLTVFLVKSEFNNYGIRINNKIIVYEYNREDVSKFLNKKIYE